MSDKDNKETWELEVKDDEKSWDVSTGSVLLSHLIAYGFATLATLIKTIAWWFNQWPITSNWNFFEKWAASAAIAGFEYLPLTDAFQFASSHCVALSLMTAYMEASDNIFRMLQQVGLGYFLGWFDWVGAVLLVLAVAFQAVCHYLRDKGAPRDVNETVKTLSNETLRIIILVIFVVTVNTSLTASLLGGPVGQVYTLATLATGAKTFAWWINQYPSIKDRPFVQKWLAGWSIAAVVEYLPLIGAFTMASNNGVSLCLMTAYMEALDNGFRLLQQYFLGKALFWFDYSAAAMMFAAVLFQGIMEYYFSPVK